MSTTEAPIQQGRFTAPLRDFIATQHAGAVLLLAATCIALAWANSPWAESYERLWGVTLAVEAGDAAFTLDLRHWINDGLMALFFFVAGLEIRREFDMGDLRERRRIATPVIAAIGGMVVPALLYLAFNFGSDGARGWGITMGTDTAFALGVLAIVGGAAAPGIRTFLLTVVIVDDILALAVIALAYTESISVEALLVAIGLFVLVAVLRRSGTRGGVLYVLGLAVWMATLLSGVHATVAGVALGLLASAHPPRQQDLERAGVRWRRFREQPTPAYARSASRSLASTISSNERLQHVLHPWTSYVIVPLFALANAGVAMSGDVIIHATSSPVTLGIVAGLVVGKPVGILAATWLSSRRWLGGAPLPIPWASLVGAATLAGVGFTVSLLIADISFEGRELEDAKLGVLGASVLAALLSVAVFWGARHLPARMRVIRSNGVLITPGDLAEPVSMDIDHVRGEAQAPVTLVMYADFACPYSARAVSILRDLRRLTGEDLRVVYRHLPLTDVHEYGQSAAEASEAAAVQAKFWEMHDRMFADQESLTPVGLTRLAATLNLDVERFDRDLAGRRHALRVSRDVESAALSGVVGTPTFFINGRRHPGSYELDALLAVVRREVDAVRHRE